MSWPPTAQDVRGVLQVQVEELPDAEANPFCEAATATAEKIVGRRSGQEFVYVVTLRDALDELYLPRAAVSVQSITENGTARDVASWEFEPTDDQYRITAVGYRFGPGRIVVRQTAPSTVPADVERAAIALACHRLRQDRPGIGAPDGPTSPMGYATPNRCMDVFRMHREIGL